MKRESQFWGIPVWAWAAGVALGAVVGFLLFDGLMVALIFGVSIGTAFAIAFSTSPKARRDE